MEIRKCLAIAFTFVVALACLLSLPWLPATAQGGFKGLTCNSVGCGGGSQKCADISMTVSGGADIIAVEVEGSVEITLYCYEPQPD